MRLYHLFFPVVVGIMHPFVVFAEDPTTLVSDGLELEAGNLSGYVNNLFELVLVIGAIIAVIVIAYAGLLYMTTDAVSGKTEGKDRITQAVIGLLMLLGIWIFFNEIHEDILKIDFSLEEQKVGGPKVDTTSSSAQTRNTTRSPVFTLRQYNSVWHTDIPEERNGVCGKIAKGWRCGYSSPDSCLRSRGANCDTYTINRAPVASFTYECNEKNPLTCLNKISEYPIYSLHTESETKTLVFTWYKSRASCIATIHDGSECITNDVSAVNWEYELQQGDTRIQLE